ncbi:hypothetical protein [Chondrinema litorale]|uniref:hypothetical protein n=1 Tax=Chondrinema litorale TaxID=2994555 RepID=UPI002542B24F|nr:hypothetical protein [Chondrinema litorale]UZS00136.1 hypothetical protein OQ292_39960 [Chondrinema litorale]
MYQIKKSSLLILIISLLAFLAFNNRFIQDDAFISFRYAENFAKGKGLVFNDGEFVEGYTNFLWTVIISSGLLVVDNPVEISYFVSILFFIGTLLSTYYLCYLITGNYTTSFISIILLGTNYSFSSYATGGLETQFQTFFLILAFILGMLNLINLTKIRLIIFSIICGLTLLIRLDSLLLLFISFLFFTKPLYNNLLTSKNKISYVLSLVLPFSLILGSWLIWKLSFYGDILPNTFYVKGTSSNYELGVIYLYQFFKSYWLIFISPVIIFSLIKKRDLKINMLILAILIWCLYITKVGGDFMEFRFMIPILPLLFVVFSYSIQHLPYFLLKLSIIIIILSGSFNHGNYFKSRYGIESIDDLHDHMYAAGENWVGIGKAMGHFFNSDSSIKIGVCAAGAIPYYSKMYTIDMHGLNDEWIAKNGIPENQRAGHQKIATFEYLIEKKVNLVLGFPKVISTGSILQINKEMVHKFVVSPIPKELQNRLNVVGIPINESTMVLALYIYRNDMIDSLIEKNSLQLYSID